MEINLIFYTVVHRGGRVRAQVDMWDLWWTKWHWDKIYPSISVSPANSHSTNYHKFINHPINDTASVVE
jgi:hypothetical protein